MEFARCVIRQVEAQPDTGLRAEVRLVHELVGAGKLDSIGSLGELRRGYEQPCHHKPSEQKKGMAGTKNPVDGWPVVHYPVVH